MVSQTGIEPVSAAPEATVLSIGLLGPVFMIEAKFILVHGSLIHK